MGLPAWRSRPLAIAIGRVSARRTLTDCAAPVSATNGLIIRKSETTPVVPDKLNMPAVIDLFAGVGGLSLGAARAGFDVKCAVEIDRTTSGTHSTNFPNAVHLTEDIHSLSGERLLAQAGVSHGKLAGLIGGPPCQGFSVIGLKTHADPRNQLLVDFFRLVAETSPAFFLAENVPGVLDSRNAQLLKGARARIGKRYVALAPFIVKACDYGAPTSRTRVFFYGYDPDRIAELVTEDFVPEHAEDIRVRQALSNLPAMRATWQKEPQSWRAVGRLDECRFAEGMTDRVPRGVGNSDALDRFRKKREVSGFLGTAHEKETIRRFEALRPGESDRVSKCTRLDPNGYCPTLRAGTGPERGSFQAIRPIHPRAHRVICPREGARLQGFPDWFQFHPTKWHAFRQIGNSVSPIVGEALLGRIFKAMS
jgi:DNA (cytosine-5)-methyltransferase 1